MRHTEVTPETELKVGDELVRDGRVFLIQHVGVIATFGNPLFTYQFNREDLNETSGASPADDLCAKCVLKLSPAGYVARAERAEAEVERIKLDRDGWQRDAQERKEEISALEAEVTRLTEENAALVRDNQWWKNGADRVIDQRNDMEKRAERAEANRDSWRNLAELRHELNRAYETMVNLGKP